LADKGRGFAYEKMEWKKNLFVGGGGGRMEVRKTGGFSFRTMVADRHKIFISGKNSDISIVSLRMLQ
jgi:hypothetical protein